MKLKKLLITYDSTAGSTYRFFVIFCFCMNKPDLKYCKRDILFPALHSSDMSVLFYRCSYLVVLCTVALSGNLFIHSFCVNLKR